MLPLLRRLHRWTGLLLALPLIVQAVTGCIMAVDPLLECCATTAASPPLRDPASQVPAMVAAAQTAVPGGLAVRRIRLGDGGSWIDFSIPRSQAQAVQVSVDPATLRVLDVQTHTGTFYRWVHSLHETFLYGLQGRTVVGWSGVGLLFLGLSGIPLWWPSPGRLRAALTVSRRARGPRLVRELHGAVGIWAVVMLVLQSLSGITLAFPQTARALAGVSQEMGSGQRGGASEAAADPTPSIGAAVSAALHAVPDAALQELRLPATAGRPIMAVLLPRGQWNGAPPAIVMLDPATARVRAVQDPRTQSWGVWALGWMRALHYGDGLGLGWRLLVVAAGLTLPLLPVTGVLIWLLRRQRRISRQRQSAALSAGQSL